MSTPPPPEPVVTDMQRVTSPSSLNATATPPPSLALSMSHCKWSALPKDWLEEITTYLTLKDMLEGLAPTCRSYAECMKGCRCCDSAGTVTFWSFTEQSKKWKRLLSSPTRLLVKHFRTNSIYAYHKPLGDQLKQQCADLQLGPLLAERLPQLLTLDSAFIDCSVDPSLFVIDPESDIDYFPRNLTKLVVNLYFHLHWDRKSQPSKEDQERYWINVMEVLTVIGQLSHLTELSLQFEYNSADSNWCKQIPDTLFQELPKSLTYLKMNTTASYLKPIHFSQFRRLSNLTYLYTGSEMDHWTDDKWFQLTSPSIVDDDYNFVPIPPLQYFSVGALPEFTREYLLRLPHLTSIYSYSAGVFGGGYPGFYGFEHLGRSLAPNLRRFEFKYCSDDNINCAPLMLGLRDCHQLEELFISGQCMRRRDFEFLRSFLPRLIKLTIVKLFDDSYSLFWLCIQPGTRTRLTYLKLDCTEFNSSDLLHLCDWHELIEINLCSCFCTLSDEMIEMIDPESESFRKDLWPKLIDFYPPSYPNHTNKEDH